MSPTRARAERLLDDAALLQVLDSPAEVLISPLADVADPDQALLALAKLAGAVVGDRDLVGVLRGILEDDGPARARLLAVVGASVALGDTLVAHPETLRVLLDDDTGHRRPGRRGPRRAARGRRRRPRRGRPGGHAHRSGTAPTRCAAPTGPGCCASRPPT